MMNVLPIKEQKIIKDEYKVRLLIVILIFLFITTLVSTALLYPGYFSLKERRYNSTLYLKVLEKNNVTVPDKLVAIIKGVKSKVGILKKESSNMEIYEDIFSSIIKNKGNIKIYGLVYDKTKDAGPYARVTGFSPDRDSLLSFIQRLKEKRQFINVDTPVSNFVKNKNIEFSLSIKLKNGL